MPLNHEDADYSWIGADSLSVVVRKWLVGTVIKFPDEGRIVRFGRADAQDESATVIILPVFGSNDMTILCREHAGSNSPPPERTRRAPPREAPLKIGPPMLPRNWLSRRLKFQFVIFAALVVSGCSSIGDFGRLQSPLVSDDIHAWVGQEAAAHARRSDLGQ
jgi:hypothetical protein